MIFLIIASVYELRELIQLKVRAMTTPIILSVRRFEGMKTQMYKEEHTGRSRKKWQKLSTPRCHILWITYNNGLYVCIQPG
jgi:hypothetical protein